MNETIFDCLWCELSDHLVYISAKVIHCVDSVEPKPKLLLQQVKHIFYWSINGPVGSPWHRKAVFDKQKVGYNIRLVGSEVVPDEHLRADPFLALLFSLQSVDESCQETFEDFRSWACKK